MSMWGECGIVSDCRVYSIPIVEERVVQVENYVLAPRCGEVRKSIHITSMNRIQYPDPLFFGAYKYGFDGYSSVPLKLFPSLRQVCWNSMVCVWCLLLSDRIADECTRTSLWENKKSIYKDDLMAHGSWHGPALSYLHVLYLNGSMKIHLITSRHSCARMYAFY